MLFIHKLAAQTKTFNPFKFDRHAVKYAQRTKTVGWQGPSLSSELQWYQEKVNIICQTIMGTVQSSPMINAKHSGTQKLNIALLQSY